MAEIGIAALALAVMVQGGFFARVYIVASILLLVGIFLQMLEKRKADLKIWPLWLLLGLLYMISSFYHKFQVKEWDKVIYILSIGVMHFYFCHLNKKERQCLQRALVRIGTLECIIGALAYAGMPIPGIIMNMRFMGTFQYANATALFLGILLILQTDTEMFKQADILGIRILFTVFLQLTFSFGGILCYFMGLMVLTKNSHSDLFQYIQEFVISGIFSGSIFVVKFYFCKAKSQADVHANSFGGSHGVFDLNKSQVLVWIILLLLFVVCFCSSHFLCKLWEKVQEKFYLRMAVMGMLVTEVIVCFYRFGKRARGTGWERIQQMKDGITIIGKNWWLGIGPHRLLEILQDMGVSYETTLIHNSYIQVGVEAGIFAVGIILILLLLWWGRMKKLNNRSFSLWQISVMLMALFHFMIDITFFFWAIMGIFMLCVTGKEDGG